MDRDALSLQDSMLAFAVGKPISPIKTFIISVKRLTPPDGPPPYAVRFPSYGFTVRLPSAAPQAGVRLPAMAFCCHAGVLAVEAAAPDQAGAILCQFTVGIAYLIYGETLLLGAEAPQAGVRPP